MTSPLFTKSSRLFFSNKFSSCLYCCFFFFCINPNISKEMVALLQNSCQTLHLPSHTILEDHSNFPPQFYDFTNNVPGTSKMLRFSKREGKLLTILIAIDDTCVIHIFFNLSRARKKKIERNRQWVILREKRFILLSPPPQQ